MKSKLLTSIFALSVAFGSHTLKGDLAGDIGELLESPLEQVIGQTKESNKALHAFKAQQDVFKLKIIGLNTKISNANVTSKSLLDEIKQIDKDFIKEISKLRASEIPAIEDFKTEIAALRKELKEKPDAERRKEINVEIRDKTKEIALEKKASKDEIKEFNKDKALFVKEKNDLKGARGRVKSKAIPLANHQVAKWANEKTLEDLENEKNVLEKKIESLQEKESDLQSKTARPGVLAQLKKVQIDLKKSERLLNAIPKKITAFEKKSNGISVAIDKAVELMGKASSAKIKGEVVTFETADYAEKVREAQKAKLMTAQYKKMLSKVTVASRKIDTQVKTALTKSKAELKKIVAANGATLQAAAPLLLYAVLKQLEEMGDQLSGRRDVADAKTSNKKFDRDLNLSVAKIQTHRGALKKVSTAPFESRSQQRLDDLKVTKSLLNSDDFRSLVSQLEKGATFEVESFETVKNRAGKIIGNKKVKTQIQGDPLKILKGGVYYKGRTFAPVTYADFKSFMDGMASKFFVTDSDAQNFKAKIEGAILKKDEILLAQLVQAMGVASVAKDDLFRQALSGIVDFMNTTKTLVELKKDLVSKGKTLIKKENIFKNMRGPVVKKDTVDERSKSAVEAHLRELEKKTKLSALEKVAFKRLELKLLKFDIEALKKIIENKKTALKEKKAEETLRLPHELLWNAYVIAQSDEAENASNTLAEKLVSTFAYVLGHPEGVLQNVEKVGLAALGGVNDMERIEVIQDIKGFSSNELSKFRVNVLLSEVLEKFKTLEMLGKPEKLLMSTFIFQDRPVKFINMDILRTIGLPKSNTPFFLKTQNIKDRLNTIIASRARNKGVMQRFEQNLKSIAAVVDHHKGGLGSILFEYAVVAKAHGLHDVTESVVNFFAEYVSLEKKNTQEYKDTVYRGLIRDLRSIFDTQGLDKLKDDRDQSEDVKTAIESLSNNHAALLKNLIEKKTRAINIIDVMKFKEEILKVSKTAAFPARADYQAHALSQIKEYAMREIK
ncbi:MAG: hypothetical protein JKY13_00005, partial [Gammaproteobacteria bacterium]|nr:hypothetical protein [Gammaproteobacteria bacterium]